MRATWIEACKPPVVPGTKIHAMAFTPLALYVVWWSWATFLLVVVVSLTMGILQAKGRHPMWVVNRLQSKLRSETVHARSAWYLRRRTRLETLDVVPVDDAYSLVSASDPPAVAFPYKPQSSHSAPRRQGTGTAAA